MTPGGPVGNRPAHGVRTHGPPLVPGPGEKVLEKISELSGWPPPVKLCFLVNITPPKYSYLSVSYTNLL